MSNEEESVVVRARAGHGMPENLLVRKGSSLLMVMWVAYYAAIGMVHSSLSNLVFLLRPDSHRSLEPVGAKVDGQEVENIRTSSINVTGGEEIRFYLF